MAVWVGVSGLILAAPGQVRGCAVLGTGGDCGEPGLKCSGDVVWEETGTQRGGNQMGAGWNDKQIRSEVCFPLSSLGAPNTMGLRPYCTVHPIVPRVLQRIKDGATPGS